MTLFDHWWFLAAAGIMGLVGFGFSLWFRIKYGSQKLSKREFYGLFLLAAFTIGCIIYACIDIAINGLQRRHRQIRENMGGIDPGTHQEQFRQRQQHLRKLLFEALSKGCTNFRGDAWGWATIPSPSPTV